MKSVFVAGATGYLGRFLCAEYQRRGWYVTALVRDVQRARHLAADALVEAEATRPESFSGAMAGGDLVVSALGITRQADGLDYRDVDYGANLALLREAEHAGVSRFAYIHVLNADRMRHVPLVAAKSAFVEQLRSASIPSTVIAPSGYFSDMEDVLAMARSGRVLLFGDGARRLNPIHGADLAHAVANATDSAASWRDVGGPDVLTQSEVAELAFSALKRPARITRLPDVFRKAALRVLPRVTPRKVHGPAQFFLTAMGLDMVGECHGTRRLKNHFVDITAADMQASGANS